MISANRRPDYSRQCHDFRQNHRVWFLSRKLATEMLFRSAWNHCITSKKIKMGENEATDTFITKFLQKRLKDCSLKSAGNSSVRAFTHEWSCSSREIFDKQVIVQVYARFWKMSGLVWSRYEYFGSNTNHGSTKLALIFFRIDQKPARLHIRIITEDQVKLSRKEFYRC